MSSALELKLSKLPISSRSAEFQRLFSVTTEAIKAKDIEFPATSESVSCAPRKIKLTANSDKLSCSNTGWCHMKGVVTPTHNIEFIDLKSGDISAESRENAIYRFAQHKAFLEATRAELEGLIFPIYSDPVILDESYPLACKGNILVNNVPRKGHVGQFKVVFDTRASFSEFQMTPNQFAHVAVQIILLVKRVHTLGFFFTELSEASFAFGDKSPEVLIDTQYIRVQSVNVRDRIPPPSGAPHVSGTRPGTIATNIPGTSDIRAANLVAVARILEMLLGRPKSRLALRSTEAVRSMRASVAKSPNYDLWIRTFSNLIN